MGFGPEPLGDIRVAAASDRFLDDISVSVDGGLGVF